MSVQRPLGATPNTGGFELTAPGLTQTPSLSAPEDSARRGLGLLGLAGVLVTGLVIALAASGTDSLLPEVVRPIPDALAGAFGNTGLDVGWLGLLLVLAAMFASYAIAVRAADRLSPRAVIATIVGLHLLVLLAPPLLSTDVFSYEIYSRMGALYGTNPFFHGPHAVAFDSVYPYIDSKWVATPTSYGPLFTVISYAFASASVAVSVIVYKSIAVLSSGVVLVLLWKCARVRNVDPVRAVALFGLNPLVVIYGVGGGHNDLLMLAVVMVAVYAMLTYRERLGGAMIVVATAIKLTGGLLLPFALARGSERRTGSRRYDLLIGVGVAAVAVGVLSGILFGTGPLQLPSTLNTIQQQGDWHSIPGFISTRLGLGGVGHLTGTLLAIGFVIVLIVLVRRVAHGELDWLDGAAWATAAMLVTASALLPWYIAWLVPFAALSSDPRLLTTTLVMTGVIQTIQAMGYIPHGSTLLGI
jgi:alpha-1,6-mannosyltransferase